VLECAFPGRPLGKALVSFVALAMERFNCTPNTRLIVNAVAGRCSATFVVRHVGSISRSVTGIEAEDLSRPHHTKPVSDETGFWEKPYRTLVGFDSQQSSAEGELIVVRY
jgi:hypothetical protein